MELLNDRRIQLNASEQRMLVELCGALAPEGGIVSLDELRTCVETIHADPPRHDMAGFVHLLLEDLLEEAEKLHATGLRH